MPAHAAGAIAKARMPAFTGQPEGTRGSTTAFHTLSLSCRSLQAGSGAQTPRSEASEASDEAQQYLERHLARIAAGRGGGLVPAHIAEQLGEYFGEALAGGCARGSCAPAPIMRLAVTCNCTPCCGRGSKL